MVTLVLSLVVVGGAMAAIVAMTLGGPGQPATAAGGSTRDLRDRLRSVDLRRLAAALTAAPRGERPGHTSRAGARARIDAGTLVAPPPTTPGAGAPDTALLVAAPPLAPVDPAGEQDADIPHQHGTAATTAPHDRPGGWEGHGPRSAAAATPRGGGERVDHGAGDDSWVPGSGAPPPPPEVAPDEPSPLRRSARLLRGTVGLVLLLAVLGTVLAAVLAGAAAAVAIGVRAAIG